MVLYPIIQLLLKKIKIMFSPSFSKNRYYMNILRDVFTISLYTHNFTLPFLWIKTNNITTPMNKSHLVNMS